MRRLKILSSFELEINKLDDNINKPNTDDSIYWINQAIYKFIKTRFNGNAPHFTSFELNEKRTEDLIRLVKHASLISDGHVYGIGKLYNRYTYAWPDDVLYILGEEVVINANGKQYNTSVFECTIDNYMYRITNSLTDFHYRHGKARPLRVREGNDLDEKRVALLADGNYEINSYEITYISKPSLLNSDNPDANVEYGDFDDSVWFEIIKIAAQMYIENQSEQRYNTLTNEVLTQE